VGRPLNRGAPTGVRETVQEADGVDSEPRRLDGCALVTGASRGIGAAIAAELAAAGWPVAVNYRADREGAEGVVARIGEAGGTARPIGADVSDRDAVDGLFSAVEAELGKVAVLVNNAGTTADGLSMRLGDDDWDRVLETNLSAAFRLTRRAVGPMMRARFGRIVNVASVVGVRANAGQANYAASKAGLIAFTRTVAVEVARPGADRDGDDRGNRQRARRGDSGSPRRDAGGGRRLCRLPGLARGVVRDRNDTDRRWRNDRLSNR
jgi:3-oxoacyl-[acyl-carrier protein] reductase